MSAAPGDYRAYWETNIERWGEYYLEMSHGHETLEAPAWFAALYRASIGRLERKLMAERYARTMRFLDTYVKPGIVFNDLGCGTGIFTVQALRRGAVVNAIDFAEGSIRATRRNVEAHAPDARADFIVADVSRDPLPKSNVSLAMGLSPYVADLDKFLENVLQSTDLLCCLYVDPRHWSNRLRDLLPFLNVRRLQFHHPSDVDRNYSRHAWKLLGREKFATGYIDVAARRVSSPGTH
jgi:SAM-dependent methyltransferase